MRLVGLLSFLGWSQRVGAFFFHSLSCFRGAFDADSVGKKIGKGDGLMCVIESRCSMPLIVYLFFLF